MMKDDDRFKNEYRREIDSYPSVPMNELKKKVMVRAARRKRMVHLISRMVLLTAACGILFLACCDYILTPVRSINAAGEEAPLSYAGQMTVSLEPINYAAINSENGLCGIYILNLDCGGRDFTEVKIEIEGPEASTDEGRAGADFCFVERLTDVEDNYIENEWQKETPDMFFGIKNPKDQWEYIVYRGDLLKLSFDEIKTHDYGVAVDFHQVEGEERRVSFLTLKITGFRADGSFVSDEAVVEVDFAKDFNVK